MKHSMQSVYGEDKLMELEEAMKEVLWDIIGIAEIRRSYEKIAERNSGHIFCHSAATRGNRGVGFFVNKLHSKSITEFKPVSDRIAFLRLSIGNNKLMIIQAHAPTSDISEEDIKYFYESIERGNDAQENWRKTYCDGRL
ncbi:hypothetical protein LSTR_LSTR010892 [Laodelphax striatellus]|uniref:Uncharacterized protein n=1 Tax=Laodelphax striatellus TaxID=195883 RepID=A0A482XL00_LAOST|nr:hypothetical protein LSTR_LSTR010892 [Laodelphax striatellus]